MTRSSHPGRRTLILTATLFAVALIVRLPASLITLTLPAEVQLQNVEGSFWNGKASAIGFDGVIVQERIVWRFHPKSLLNARLLWNLDGQMAGRNSRLVASLDLGGAVLNDVDAIFPLEPLVAAQPKLKPLQLGAMLHATAKTMSLDTRWEAAVTIEQLFSPLAPQGNLGNYRMTVRAEPGGKGVWQLTTLGGNLQATGKGTFDMAQNSGSGQLALIPQPSMQGLALALASLPKAGEGYQFTF